MILGLIVVGIDVVDVRCVDVTNDEGVTVADFIELEACIPVEVVPVIKFVVSVSGNVVVIAIEELGDTFKEIFVITV